MRWAAGLRWPWLFFLAALLLGLDLVIPDFIPFVDELLLAIATLLLGAWKKRAEPPTDAADRAKRVN